MTAHQSSVDASLHDSSSPYAQNTIACDRTGGHCGSWLSISWIVPISPPLSYFLCRLASDSIKETPSTEICCPVKILDLVFQVLVDPTPVVPSEIFLPAS